MILFSFVGWKKLHSFGLAKRWLLYRAKPNVCNAGRQKEILKKSMIGACLFHKIENHKHSLPNKISDYIQSGVPVVCSNFPEMIKVVKHFEVGEIIENHSEEELQKKIRTVLQNGKIHYAEKLKQAAEILCWENEENPLLGLYQQIVDENFKTQ